MLFVAKGSMNKFPEVPEDYWLSNSERSQAEGSVITGLVSTDIINCKNQVWEKSTCRSDILDCALAAISRSKKKKEKKKISVSIAYKIILSASGLNLTWSYRSYCKVQFIISTASYWRSYSRIRQHFGICLYKISVAYCSDTTCK